MRILFLAAIAVAAAAASQPSPSPHKPNSLQGADCPSPSIHFAHKGGIWQDGRVAPQKLTELPPADAFAAVYRRDERGCMVPVRYRDVRR